MSSKVPIETDPRTETYSGVAVKKASAVVVRNDDEYCVHVIGVAETLAGVPLDDDVEVEVLISSRDGEPIGRGTEYFPVFGIRRSFEIRVDLSDSSAQPGNVTLLVNKSR